MPLLSRREKRQGNVFLSQRQSRVPLFLGVSIQLRGTPHISKSSPFSGREAASSLKQKQCMFQNHLSSTRETTGSITGQIMSPKFLS